MPYIVIPFSVHVCLIKTNKYLYNFADQVWVIVSWSFYEKYKMWSAGVKTTGLDWGLAILFPPECHQVGLSWDFLINLGLWSKRLCLLILIKSQYK